MTKFIEVKWYDACSTNIDNDILKHVMESPTAKHLLAINTTYGKIFKLFDDVVVIITEDSTGKNIEVTIIPRVWIISPKKFKLTSKNKMGGI